MPIDAFASEPHYIDHIAPVWRALPEEKRGIFRILNSPKLRSRCEQLGIAAQPDGPAARRPCIIAGAQDLRQVWGGLGILIEHGAGQTYRGLDHPSWAGGKDRGRVRLFICPSERVAEANRLLYPDAADCIASPRMEHLAQLHAGRHWEGFAPRIVSTFHWDCLIDRVPELRSAFPEWREALFHLSKREPMTAHAHPRAQAGISGWAEASGIPFEPRFEFLAAALPPGSPLLVDNSSAAYEWAALGQPVVCLNSHHYRPDIEHGLRFWAMSPGPWLWPNLDPERLADEILAAIAHARDPWWDQRRAEITEAVFPRIEGSAQRAAEAILETFDA